MKCYYLHIIIERIVTFRSGPSRQMVIQNIPSITVEHLDTAQNNHIVLQDPIIGVLIKKTIIIIREGPIPIPDNSNKTIIHRALVLHPPNPE